MSTLDSIADKTQAAADKLPNDGLKGKLGDELADDAAFIRKLKPSLMKKRLKGEAPTDGQAGEPRRAPSGPQLGARPKPNGGPNPFVIVGVALAAGVLLAKFVDWRGHAHPRH
jgi:hypothetical protein